MRMLQRLSAVLVIALVATVAGPGVAWADDPDESEHAYDLVRQAIALIVNTPDDLDLITDKITDATEAPDPSEVQIPLVQQAADTWQAGDLHQTRALLEQSIGARVHTSTADPVPIGEPAPVTGSETGTIAAMDPLPGRDGLSTLNWVMLAISSLVLIGGVVLAARLRPRNLPHPGPTAKD
ncbi:hypothetical protein ACIBL3_12170 [Kribbella sp. NPDC050124]|uniref:hypothetical protein n=1 Tax=Kribbella sp. NPDC050124 TaxID=3364114 RepID=UPI0037B48A1F